MVIWGPSARIIGHAGILETGNEEAKGSKPVLFSVVFFFLAKLNTCGDGHGMLVV